MRGWTSFSTSTEHSSIPRPISPPPPTMCSRSQLAGDQCEIRPFVGHGALAMIAEALRSHGRKVSDDELIDLFEIFITHYTARIADNSRPYPALSPRSKLTKPKA